MTSDEATGGLRTVHAAGGIVLDGPDDARLVLVVHRPRYDDWSLPKGHVEDGEQPATAATREVLEETGVVTIVRHEVGTTEYPVVTTDGAARKRVHWFVMRVDPTTGDPITAAARRMPDAEVDDVAWWPVERARHDLTHASDRALLDRVVDAR